MIRQNKYPILLSIDELSVIEAMFRKGTHKARTILRGRILRAVHQGIPQQQICRQEKVGRTTPYDICKRYHEGGLERALYDAPRPGQPPRLDGKESAQVLAIACSEPPDGFERWTLGMITVEAKRQTGKSPSQSTINRLLLENDVKPWLKKNVVRSFSG